MIEVALNGGLGNQLFQYAAARALAQKYQTNLVLDLIPLYSKLQLKNAATFRPYELEHFNIQAACKLPFFTNKYLYPIAKSAFYVHKFSKKLQLNYFKENHFEFDSSMLAQPDNTYLDGHFQSEKYFKSIEHIIRKELTFKNNLDAVNLATQQKIEQSNAVAIHIRRGDYISIKRNASKFATISIRYYLNAIQYIAAKISSPIFYIFSDDIEWAKENLKVDFPLFFINHNNSAAAAYKDMQLMSLCKHNIIANSTFSWWSAWLNNNPEKIIIAPQKWFEDSSINSNDIYPTEWIKL